MNRIIKIISTIVLIFSGLALTSCNDKTTCCSDKITSKPANIEYYTVTFDPNNGNDIFSLKVMKFGRVSKPIISAKSDCALEGWYTKNNKQWNFSRNIIINQDLTLTARWKNVANDYQIKETNENSVAIISYNGLDENVEIPSMFNNKEVKEIKENVFKNNKTIQSIIIPEGVKSIGSWSFQNCSSLTSITLPSSITYIGEHVFDDCYALHNVYYNGTIKSWCNIPFAKHNLSPMQYAEHFYMLNEHKQYKEVKNIVIPSGVTSIGAYQFYCFENIVSIEISSSVKSIESNAFYGCTNLTSIVIPESVKSIGFDVFIGCDDSLKNVYYTGTIKSWCDIKFIDLYSNPMKCAQHFYLLNENYEYEEVKNIKIPSSVTTIGKNQFVGFNNVVSIEIPSSVTSIGTFAFTECSSLTSVTIFKGLTIIGTGAFERCISLTSITIPNSVTHINNFAFYECRSLASIIIPESVTSIGNRAFYGCSSLTAIFCETKKSYEYDSEGIPVYYSNEWKYINGVPTPLN